MNETISAWEPQARALMRIMAAVMLLAHALREVFGVLPGRPKGPGSFMPLDLLGQIGGIILLICSVLILIGWFVRVSSVVAALQCLVAYFYASAPRGPWPLRNGGIDTLTYVLVLLYLAEAGAGAWSVDRHRPA